MQQRGGEGWCVAILRLTCDLVVTVPAFCHLEGPQLQVHGCNHYNSPHSGPRAFWPGRAPAVAGGGSRGSTSKHAAPATCSSHPGAVVAWVQCYCTAPKLSAWELPQPSHWRAGQRRTVLWRRAAGGCGCGAASTPSWRGSSAEQRLGGWVGHVVASTCSCQLLLQLLWLQARLASPQAQVLVGEASVWRATCSSRSCQLPPPLHWPSAQ